ncbi:13914_t:CDS:2 [Funneliformis caledonium]|uniref:13914_t:CDS:1 n=1 Tax=Funneliformis caledonium TaxID=1117310 RepID=A0A9N9BBV8_9GLOM|nr:13914_t:CDS:2 [Funneliformis caledonium]
MNNIKEIADIFKRDKGEKEEHEEYKGYREEIEYKDNIPQASKKKLNLNNLLVTTEILKKH